MKTTNVIFEAQLQYQQLLEVDPNNLYAKTRLQTLAQLSPMPNVTKNVPPVSIIETDVTQIIADAPTLKIFQMPMS